MAPSAGTTALSWVATEYGACACSAVGKVKRTSRPYVPNGTPVWTEFEYDPRGRTVKVTQPGGGFTSYAYDGNTVTVTEPLSDPTKPRWKKYTTDGLGRLVQVSEPRPGVSGATDETVYEYNVLDKLTKVTMTRGSTTQVRNFSYDAEMRLQSVAQPENGTVSYTYDTLGRILTRIDAKNQKTEYGYETHGRISTVKRYPVSTGAEDAAQRTTYNYDTAVNGWGRVASVVTGQGYTEAFEYSAGGLVTKKSLTVPGALRALAAVFGYNNEGQRTSLKYPDITDDSGYVVLTGKTVTSSFDSFGRPLSLNDGTDLVRNGAWSLAGRLTGMEVRNGAVYEARTWTYNNLGQLTGQTATGVNLEYTYPAVNDGRLLKRKDNVSGEEVAYQYDEIGRLISAATTAPTGGWGLAWVYDGFGNRLQQNITKGSAYSMQLTVDAATNRLVGFSYDSNGNQTGWSTPSGPVTAVYDVENRMAAITTPSSAQSYHYSAANQRLRKPRDAASEDIFFYGLGGELLGAYGRYNGATSFYPSAGWQKEYVYFAGVQVLPAAVEDRVGSVVKSAEWGGTSGYFPYGEQMGGASGDDRKKFGTYWRDSSSGLDYAQNRYYAAAWGRFTSADPYVMSGGLANPQGWNRYAYVGGDPANYTDRRGLNRDACETNSAGDEDPECVARRGGRVTLAFGLGMIPNGEYGQYGGAIPTLVRTPATPVGGTGGGGNPVVTNRLQALSALKYQIRHLGAHCREILPSESTLLGNAEELVFWDARIEGSVQVGFLPGTTPSTPGATLSSELGRNNAVILLGPGGSISPHVVLGDGFFGQDAATQGITLLHELLHYTTQLDDKSLTSPSYYNITLRTGDSYSSAFQDWLKNDCKNPK